MSRLAMAATIILALAFGGYGMLQPEIEAQSGDDARSSLTRADYGYASEDYGQVDYGSEMDSCASGKAGYSRKMAGRSGSCPVGSLAATAKSKSACGTSFSKPMTTAEAMGFTVDTSCDGKAECPDGMVCEPAEQVAEETYNVDYVAQQASEALIYFFSTPDSVHVTQTTSLSRGPQTALPVTR